MTKRRDDEELGENIGRIEAGSRRLRPFVRHDDHA